MTDASSPHPSFESAESLAFSPELQAFCDAQQQFIEGELDEEAIRHRATTLAREARRRRLTPEVLLLAMEMGGCHRSLTVREDPDRSTRYFSTLHHVLSTYYESSGRPADRRLEPRDPTPREGEPPTAD